MNGHFLKEAFWFPILKMTASLCLLARNPGKNATLQIKDLKIVEHQPRQIPIIFFHLGKAIEKTSYAFVEPWKSHQQFMISSQPRLAEGKGFKGSLIEKMLYANFNMLTWITDEYRILRR